MSLTPEEQRVLAIECGAVFDLKTMVCESADAIVMLPEELAAYTAAVEAKERGRCDIKYVKKDGEHYLACCELLNGGKNE